MGAILFSLCYFGFLIVYLRIVYAFRQQLMRSFLGAYFLSFFFLNYIGLAILFFGLDSYRADIGVNDPHLITWMLIYSILAFACVAISYFALYPASRRAPVRPVSSSWEENLLAYLALALTILAVFQIVRNSNSIALMLALTGNDNINEVMVARSEMGNNNSGSHWIRIATSQLPMILFYFFYLRYFGGNVLSNVFLLAAALAVCVILTFSTAKFAIIQFLIGLSYIQWKYIKPLSFGKVVQRGVVVFGLIIAMYVSFTEIANISTAVRVALSRMVTGSIAPAHFYLEYFPNVYPFLLGRSFPNPMGIFPWEPYSVSVEIMNWKFPHFADLNIIGSSPTAFWGEGYANFGFVGVLISGFYLGAFMAVNQRVFDRYNRFLFIRAVEGWVFCYFFAANISGVSEYMKVTVIFPLIALLILPRIRLR
jgi:hypothetical protein